MVTTGPTSLVAVAVAVVERSVLPSVTVVGLKLADEDGLEELGTGTVVVDSGGTDDDVEVGGGASVVEVEVGIALVVVDTAVLVLAGGALDVVVVSRGELEEEEEEEVGTGIVVTD